MGTAQKAPNSNMRSWTLSKYTAYDPCHTPISKQGEQFAFQALL